MDELEEEYIETANAPGTQRNKSTQLSQYLDFCEFSHMRPFPTNEFKISKYAAFLSKSVKTVQSIKAYCATVCEEHELKGFRPVCKGVKFYHAIAGIRHALRHQVKRAAPMTEPLLEKIATVVNFRDDKDFVVWVSLVSGYFLVLRKGNMVPVKRLHDTFHNICRKDIRYQERVMVFCFRWLKTNQFGEELDTSPVVADNSNKLCVVRWVLYMMNRIPAAPHHNLFSYVGKEGLVPITYRDLMVNLRKWIRMLGGNDKAFSSHSLRRGAVTSAYKKDVTDIEIQTLGKWKSQCFRTYIQKDAAVKLNAWLKFTK